MLNVNCGDPKLSIMHYLFNESFDGRLFRKFDIVNSAKEIYKELDEHGYITLNEVNKIITRHSKTIRIPSGIFSHAYDTVGWYDDEIMKNCIVNIEDLSYGES